MSSSLDRELENLMKPIPKGIDLGWTESGNTFTPTDTNSPWSQAPSIMGQWIFNRNITKTAGRPLMPEERAIGQTVIAHINSGVVGERLDSALASTFGREICIRHAGLINHIKKAATGSVPLLDGLDPTVGVSLATQMGTGGSDRNELRNHETQMTANTLQSYKSKQAPMVTGAVSLCASELQVDIQGAGPNVCPQLSEGDIDQIKLAAQSFIKANDDIGLGIQQATDSENMLSAGEVNPLDHRQETEILDGGREELDFVFGNRQTGLDNFSLDSNNALIGCDADLESEIGGTPPNQILQPEAELLQLDCDYEDEDGEEEGGDLHGPQMNVEFEEEPQQKLGMEFNNDFEIEL